MIGGGAAAVAASITVPLVQYTGNLHAEPPPDFLEIAKADYTMPPGASKIILYGRVPALLVQTPDPGSELLAFVAVCTHFDCTVDYKPSEKCIYCACHEGYYDLQGNVVKGPPPRPLRRFHQKRQGDRLAIALEPEHLERAFSEPRT
jgi:Rieske Fe-S protein